VIAFLGKPVISGSSIGGSVGIIAAAFKHLSDYLRKFLLIVNYKYAFFIHRALPFQFNI
jgi:hypothetical protein